MPGSLVTTLYSHRLGSIYWLFHTCHTNNGAPSCLPAGPPHTQNWACLVCLLLPGSHTGFGSQKGRKAWLPVRRRSRGWLTCPPPSTTWEPVTHGCQPWSGWLTQALPDNNIFPRCMYFPAPSASLAVICLKKALRLMPFSEQTMVRLPSIQQEGLLE